MTTAPKKPLCGLVLAGGRSSRMGTDKAALRHPDGRTLARRSYDLLVEAGCETVVLSLRHEQDPPPGFADLTDLAVVRDPAGESQGPLTGMLAGMRLRPDADWLVVATDLPHLDEATLTHLVAAKLPEELLLAYRSESDELPEPLAALYAGAAIPILEEALAAGLKCPRKILIRNHCRLLEPVTPRALDNANTPEDWQAARLMTPAATYHICYYGLLAERRGVAEEQMTHAATTPAGLYSALDDLYHFGLAQAALRVAVNDEFVPWHHPLRDGDRIALLPPMSGG